ncbi:MAG: Ribosomal protein [Chloroflexota bacterium]
MDLIRTMTNEQMKRDLPPIKTGDTVKVSAKVVEGNRERIQVRDLDGACAPWLSH